MVVLIVIGVALAMFVAERARPGRDWPVVPGWWARAAVANGLQIAAVFVAGMTWEPWFRRHRLLSLAELGFGTEVSIGYLVNALFLYWTHRARHELAVLWRWLHQLHHSPARIEILTAFYKHPLEISRRVDPRRGAALSWAGTVAPRRARHLRRERIAGPLLSLERFDTSVARLHRAAPREPLPSP